MSPTRGDITQFWSRYLTCPRCWQRKYPPRRLFVVPDEYVKCPRCYRIWHSSERAA